MIGSKLKTVLQEQNIKVNELARKTGISAQTLYSLIKRDTNNLNVDVLLTICDALDVPIEVFLDVSKSSLSPTAEELLLIKRYRSLDAHGQELVKLILSAEQDRLVSEAPVITESPKIIPLYATPAAAGYANPSLGEDYEDYEVDANSRADFAARIQGDSMQPYIEDGSIVLVCRNMPISDGDIGLFFVDGDIKCKQYCEDSFGNIYLFSLNRERSDADSHITASSGITVFCFGKVLMPRKVALP